MYYENNFLFSEAYIQDTFKKMERNTKEYDEIFDNICLRYLEYKNNWTLFEDIVLDTLRLETEKDGKYRWIKSASNDAVALVYLLDKECITSSTMKGRYYAVDAITKAKGRNVTWVIITNGLEWRLFSTLGVSPYEHSFSVNIENELNEKKVDIVTHIFVYMFGADIFKKNGAGILAIDTFKDKSDESKEYTEYVLCSKAESILTGLCYGLKENMNKEYFSDEDKKNIYEAAIIIMYRLLFLGYAEARGLLPVSTDEIDYQNSFTMLCKTAKDYYLESKLNEIESNFDFWDRLGSQFRICVDKNYNYGLFSDTDNPILKEYRIANKHLVPCLMELGYISGRKNDYAKQIEYKDLSVRNLGAIYEGVLEYQLFIADELMVKRKSKEKIVYLKASETILNGNDKNNMVHPGEIYLSHDAMECKETGTYYTPEDVVDYIVKNTIGKKLEELRKSLESDLTCIRTELLSESTKQRIKLLQHEIDDKTVKFINDKILSLSIVDSAMGGANFLVNAAYQVSNYIVDILESNKWENEELNVDVSYWRRKVVENCIYGIDINNISVYLARLSLGLISSPNDKPLPFLDHHLKCGNSIVGTNIDKIQYMNKSISLFNMTKEQYMHSILKKYEKIKEVGSDTKAGVELQYNTYKEIIADFSVIKHKMDYYLTKIYADGISDEDEFQRIMYSDDISFFDAPELKSLMKYADDNSFFHWEIEFPEVFISGGFDIAIGNPPYVECSAARFEKLDLYTIDSQNLYAYMLENTIRNTKSYYGFIVPLSAMYSTKTSKLQLFLKDNGRLWISNYGVRPAKIFERAEQRVSILIGEKSDKKKIYSTDYQRWYTTERKSLFAKLRYIDVTNVDEWEFVPKVSEKIETDILEKLGKIRGTLGDYLTSENDNEVIYHSVGRYWLKAFNFIPIFSNKKTGITRSTKYKSLYFKHELDRNIVIAIINSSLFYWFWIVMSACRDFTKKDITKFPYNENLGKINLQNLNSLVEQLMESYRENSRIIETNGANGKTRLQEFHPKHSKPIIDELEKIVGRIYGLNNDEIDFIQKYDLRFRMSDKE